MTAIRSHALSDLPFVLAVVGPTAVGKTALAEELAVRLGGEVVSADSMQIYRGMDIGTAKPAADERRVPYHCIDLVEPGEPYSAALYQRDARTAFAQCAERMSLPVLCGGTGLYVRAALDPLEFPAGERDSIAREAYEAFVAANGAEALHELLAQRDPASAALLHPNNVRRVIRALEMLADETSYAEQSAGFSQRESVYPCVTIGLAMEREALYTRVDARVEAMLERGLLGEVEGLLARGFHDALTAAQAIGYKELVPVVEDGASLEVAVDSIKRASRRYAKRQLSWFRADPRVQWIDVTDLSLEHTTAQALAVLDSAAPADAWPRRC